MAPKTRYFLSSANYIVLFTIFVPFNTVLAVSSTKISYDSHCGSVVPQYPSTGTFLRPFKILDVVYGHFSGGEKLFAPEPGSSPHFPGNLDGSFFDFKINYIRKTESPATLQVAGYLSFQGPMMRVKNSHPVYSRKRSYSSFVRTNKYVRFDLSGFWSESSGTICMVGTAFANTYEGKILHLSAVFKLSYPQISSISTSIVSGAVESLDSVDSPNYFEKISVSAYAQKNYSYMDFPPSIMDSCSKLDVPKETRSFEMDSVGSYIPDLVAVELQLEHGSDCNGGNCFPFSLKNGSIFNSLSLSQIYFSEEGKFHTRIKFFNYTRRWLQYQFEPEDSLVGEGFWDHEKNLMCIVACHVLANTSVGDCSIGISLWFPMVLTIESRSHIMGRLWSNKNMNDSGYFSTLSLRELDGFRKQAPGMKYKYSLLERTRECDSINKTADLGSRAYPDVNSMGDLSFSLFSASKGGSSARGHAYPFSIGDTIIADSFYEKTTEGMNVTIWSVSYTISYMFYTKSSSNSGGSVEIFAEGLYNSGNGQLCMVGCMYHRSFFLDNQTNNEDSKDCNILINFQFPPIDPKEGEHLEGTIKSTRQRSDPLYFEPLSFSSYKMYEKTASESLWRMDVEIIMVVISLTLSCVFVRSQILYAKKHQEALQPYRLPCLL